MAKDIKFDIEARDGLKRGVDALANAESNFRTKRS
jgi:chaperonin GroEL